MIGNSPNKMEDFPANHVDYRMVKIAFSFSNPVLICVHVVGNGKPVSHFLWLDSCLRFVRFETKDLRM